MIRRPIHRHGLIVALTKREQKELSDIVRRINNVRRVLGKLEVRRRFILGRVPVHKVAAPQIPPTSQKPPVQPTLF